MPQGSITDQDIDFVETWENIAPYQSAVITLDRRGDERPVVITGRRTFMLTTQDRIITEDRILDPKNDPFLNGAFRPVVVPDSIDVKSNPNALSDEEIVKIFSASELAWSEWLSNIDSVATLRRMLDLADEAESLSLKRYRQIEARLLDVRPRTQLEVKDPQLRNFLSDRPNAGQTGAGGAVANSGASNPRRGQGGRSSDYR